MRVVWPLRISTSCPTCCGCRGRSTRNSRLHSQHGRDRGCGRRLRSRSSRSSRRSRWSRVVAAAAGGVLGYKQSTGAQGYVWRAHSSNLLNRNGQKNRKGLLGQDPQKFQSCAEHPRVSILSAVKVRFICGYLAQGLAENLKT